MCSNDVDRPVGTVIHTGMQNRHGGYENDCSVIRTDENRLYEKIYYGNYNTGMAALNIIKTMYLLALSRKSILVSSSVNIFEFCKRLVKVKM